MASVKELYREPPKLYLAITSLARSLQQHGLTPVVVDHTMPQIRAALEPFCGRKGRPFRKLDAEALSSILPRASVLVEQSLLEKFPQELAGVLHPTSQPLDPLRRAMDGAVDLWLTGGPLSSGIKLLRM